MDPFFEHFFGWFGMPSIGLPAVFVSAFVSATLLPVGSEPILFGYITINPHLYWIAIFVATVGNTLGGMLDWWLGFVASKGIKSLEIKTKGRLHKWLEAWGPKILLLSWLPGFGDPLCVAAGWLRLAWLPCMVSLIAYGTNWDIGYTLFKAMTALNRAILLLYLVVI